MGIAYILTVVFAPTLTNPNRRRYQIVHKLSPHDGTLSTDCYHLRWYSDTSEYLPHEGTVNGYVRLLEIYEAHEERHSCLPPKFLQPAHHKHLQAIEDTIQTSHRYPGGSERASRSYSKVIGTGLRQLRATRVRPLGDAGAACRTTGRSRRLRWGVDSPATSLVRNLVLIQQRFVGRLSCSAVAPCHPCQ